MNLLRVQVFLLLNHNNIRQKLIELIFVARLQTDLCHKEVRSVYNWEDLAWLYTISRCNLHDYMITFLWYIAFQCFLKSGWISFVLRHTVTETFYLVDYFLRKNRWIFKFSSLAQIVKPCVQRSFLHEICLSVHFSTG